MSRRDAGGLAAALEVANLPTLLLCLAQITGDEKWLHDPYRPTKPRGLDDHDSGGFPPEIQARIRAAALEILLDVPEGAGADLPVERVAPMLAVSLGEPVDDMFSGLFAEELGLSDRAVEMPALPPGRELRIVIIGAGLSGLCQAIQLERAGIPYTIVEKNQDVGGTWLENTYPGCGVDTPSHLYAFSFAQNPTWSRYFAKRDELQAYWEGLAEEHGVRRHIRFGEEVTSAVWDDAAGHWRLELCGPGGRATRLDADVVISAVGLLNRPALPRIAGLEDFTGPVAHTACWPHDLDVAGKRVVVVGTGASAMQLVPAIAGVAAHVTVLQRSPQWAVPYPTYLRDVPDGVQHLMEHVPFYLGWYRLRILWKLGDRVHPILQIDPAWPHPERAINKANDAMRLMLTQYIEHELRERPDLLEKSLPRYPVYGKRLLMDNGWFRTIARDDVSLVTEPIDRVVPEGVRTADGALHEADVVVLATGFQSLRVLGPLEVVGRSGRRLRETWGEDDARAHLGIAIPDLPNFFCLYGPNTNTGHGGTVVLGTELQVRYVMELLALLIERDLHSVEVSQEAHDAYNAELDAALERTIWTHEGMTTYYRNSRGRIVMNSPWRYVDYWRRTRRPRDEDFVLRERRALQGSVT